MVDVKTCPDPNTLSDYALGRLTDDDSELIADHLSGCETCLAALDGLAETSDSVITGLRDRQAGDAYLRERECELAVARCQSLAPTFLESQHRVDFGCLGSYRLVRELGCGGMGTVYAAIHTFLDRPVALKILSLDRLHSHEAVSRFQREMRAVGKLEHANLVRALDAGESDGRHFLAMELVNGIDLSTLVRRTGPLAIADACEILRQASIGVDQIHGHGILHRDIKPSNLMLTRTEDGKPLVKILDLGLALLENPKDGEQHELTATGQVMGTASYMAPEQGTDSHQIDVRTDIYSLGATLFKLLTGEAPISRDDRSMPRKITMASEDKPITSISHKRADVPGDLAGIVDRMLATKPEERYSTAAEVIEALTPLARGNDLGSLFDAAAEHDDRTQLDYASIATKPHATSADIDTPYSPDHQRRVPHVRQPDRSVGMSGRWRFRLALGGSLVVGGILMVFCTAYIPLRQTSTLRTHSAVSTTHDVAGMNQTPSVQMGEQEHEAAQLDMQIFAFNPVGSEIPSPNGVAEEDRLRARFSNGTPGQEVSVDLEYNGTYVRSKNGRIGADGKAYFDFDVPNPLLPVNFEGPVDPGVINVIMVHGDQTSHHSLQLREGPRVLIKSREVQEDSYMYFAIRNVTPNEEVNITVRYFYAEKSVREQAWTIGRTDGSKRLDEASSRLVAPKWITSVAKEDTIEVEIAVGNHRRGYKVLLKKGPR